LYSWLTRKMIPSSSPDSKKKRNTSVLVRNFVEKHRTNIIIYTTFAILLLFVYHFLSDGDFSFLMTLGSVFRALAFIILVYKIQSQRSASGVSLKTLILYSLVFFFRLISILIYDGYLPYDRSGDWFYQFVEVSALGVIGYLIYLIMVPFNSSYNPKLDTFGANKYFPGGLGVLLVIIPAFIIALVWHPNLNSNFITDTSWAFANYLEAVAVLPQLVMFQKKGGEIEAFTSHWVFTIGTARVLHLAFWLSSYHELNNDSGTLSRYPGFFVVFSQLVHLGLMLDFFYFYIKSVKTGGPMMLPVSARVEV